MAAAVTNDLLYEILKQIQADMSAMKATQADHTQQFVELRHILIAMQSDDLRQQAALAALRADVDTIKRRLALVDA